MKYAGSGRYFYAFVGFFMVWLFLSVRMSLLRSDVFCTGIKDQYN